MPSLVGKLNKYTCDLCKQSVITIDRDEGVTPFMMKCYATKGCKGSSYSSFYKDISGEPNFEWIKPSFAVFRKLSRSMQDHVEQGGLIIACIGMKEIMDKNA